MISIDVVKFGHSEMIRRSLKGDFFFGEFIFFFPTLNLLKRF